MEKRKMKLNRQEESKKTGLTFRQRVNGGRTLYIQFTTSDPEVINDLEQKYHSDSSLTVSKILNNFMKRSFAAGIRF